MAIRPLNSVAGFSVGETPANIILANGDITTTNITTTGVSNLNSISNVKITGGTGGQVISTDGAGNLSFITVSTAGLSNGTSNIAILNNGNITFSSGGNANIMIVTGTGVNVAGTLNTGTGNANVGNLGTAQVLATANITAPQLISNVSTGTSPLVVSSTTLVSNLNADLLDGYNTATANTASTVAVRDASGNISANFFIGNGSQLTGLNTDRISNGTSNVSIPAVDGNVNLVSAGNTTVVVTGTGANITGYANVTGNVLGGNVYANSGIIGAQTLKGEGGNISNIQGANVSGAVSSATTAGTVTTNAQPNITSVGTLTSLTATGNVAGGNLTTGGQVAATGNVTGGNLVTAGNVFAPAIISNGTYNTQIALGAASGVIAITSDGNSTQFGPGGAITLGGASQILGGTFAGSGITLGTSQTDIFQNRGGNVTVQVGAGGTIANTWTFAQDGSFTSPGNITTTANANVGNLNTGGVVAATGNVSGGNLTTAGALSVTGNANVGNLGTGGLITATGNVSGGNLTTGGVVSATGNVSGGNLTTAGVLTVTGTGVSSIAGNLDMTSNTIINLATPTNASDAATKQYVDDVAQGLHTHDSCNAATNTTLAIISGGTVTYNNGSSGVGANLTTTGSFTTIDDVTLSNGMRILVKNEANAAHNGIYDRTSSTVLTRSSDFDTPAEMAGGDFTFITAGTLYDNTGWVMTDPVTTVGTTAVNWVQFSGAGTYTAGTGLTLNGNQFNISNTAVTAATYGNGDRVASFTVNAQGQLTAASNVVIAANAANLTGTTLAATIVTSSLTSVGTLTALAVTGNVTAGNVYANSGTIGASIGLLTTGNITTINSGLLQNGNSNVTITANGNVTINAVGGPRIIATATGANITGTLGVSGNANVGNLGTAQVLATANITAPQLISNIATGTAPFVVTSTTQVANLSVATAGSATTAGTVTTNTQPNITSVGTLTSLSVTGNVSSGNISGTNGNLTTANVSGNIILGNASVTTAISWASATTTAITANQTIASFSATGITGVQFLVKGIDSAGSKYGVATVQAVTDGTNVDYSTFGTVNLGGFIGSLAVNIVGGFVRLQVTPASSNSTVWTTQYRFI